MRSGAWCLHLRRFTVDVLTGAAAMIVALAAIAGTTDIIYLLLLPGALLGVGLIVEPNHHRGAGLSPTAATAVLAQEPNPA